MIWECPSCTGLFLKKGIWLIRTWNLLLITTSLVLCPTMFMFLMNTCMGWRPDRLCQNLSSTDWQQTWWVFRLTKLFHKLPRLGSFCRFIFYYHFLAKYKFRPGNLWPVLKKILFKCIFYRQVVSTPKNWSKFQDVLISYSNLDWFFASWHDKKRDF